MKMIVKDDKLKKWLKWVDEIHEETVRLMIKTHLYDRYVEIVKANKAIWNPDDFHQWVKRNYFDSALMCIRRLSKVQNGSISLRGLLLEIRDNPNSITKEFYLRDYPKGSTDENGSPDAEALTYAYGEDVFDGKWSGGGQGLVKVIDLDLEELDTNTKIVEGFIDNTLAHRNKGAKGKQSIKTDLARQAIKTIEKIAIKYLDLMGKGGFSELTPTWQYDPEVIFTKTWITNYERKHVLWQMNQ